MAAQPLALGEVPALAAVRYATTQQPPPRELDVEVLFAFTALLRESQPAAELPLPTPAVLRAPRAISACWPGWPMRCSATRPARSIRSCRACRACSARSATRPRPTRSSSGSPPSASGPRPTSTSRALDLLELLVERRAAELQNQPGPHVQRALAAMRRAWKRDWSPGEPRLMADLLASLGTISQPQRWPTSKSPSWKVCTSDCCPARQCRRSAAHRHCPGPDLLGLFALRSGDRPVDRGPGRIPGGLRRGAAGVGQRRPEHAHRLPGKPHAVTPAAKRFSRSNSSTRPTSSRPTGSSSGSTSFMKTRSAAAATFAGQRSWSSTAPSRRRSAGPRHARPEPPLYPGQPAVRHLSHGPREVSPPPRKWRPTPATSPSSECPECSSGRRTTTRRSSPRRPTCCTTSPAPRDGLAFLIAPHRDRARLVPAEQPGRLEPARLHARPVADEVKDLGELEEPLLADRAQVSSAATCTRGSSATGRSTPSTRAITGRKRRPTSPASPTKSGPEDKQSGAACHYIADYLY